MRASRDKWIKWGLVSLLVFNFIMCTVCAGSNHIIRSKSNRRSNLDRLDSGNETQLNKRVTLSSRGDESMMTSIERPLTTKKKSRKNKDKSEGTGTTKASVDLSLVQPKNMDSKITKNKFDFGKLTSIFNSISIPTKLKNVVSKMSSVFFGKTGKDGVSTARYTENFMEGAMVPMTFLLMAAFIMDILQRLFPLPYATFVHQTAHGIKRTEPTPKPSDLTKWQVQTPLGTLGVSTNDKNRNPLNIFGRSNQGYPETVFDNNSHDYHSQQNYELTNEQAAQILNWNNHNHNQNNDNNNNNNYYQMNNISDTFSSNYDPSSTNESPYQDQQQQQEHQQMAESQQFPVSVNLENNANEGEMQEEATTTAQNQDNTQGQFDLVDYYSRFDENTEQQWKRRKRTSNKRSNM